MNNQPLSASYVNTFGLPSPMPERRAPGVLRGDHKAWASSASPRGAPGGDIAGARLLAARLKRDGRASTARQVALIMSWTDVDFNSAHEALRAPPAHAGEPPAPTMLREEERALTLLASGGHTFNVSRELHMDIAHVERLAMSLVPTVARVTLRACVALDAVQSVPLDVHAAGEPAEPVWIQLAKQGTFSGHPSGKVFKLDTTIFKQIVTNFRGNKDGRLPIDFEHACEQDPTEGSIPMTGSPAQGWIVDMAIRPDGNLWAKVEWGTLARQYIRGGQYRFISPAIHFAMKDRVTGRPIGAYISSAGLTNQPFLDGMQPLAASATSPAKLGLTATIARVMADERLPYRKAEERAIELLRQDLAAT
jgi:hypothetical protein